MDEKKLFRLHMIISGMVQGVGFRYFAVHRARLHGVNGWVRNRYDGAVEVLAEGDQHNLKLFYGDLKAGPRAGYVSNVQERWEEILELKHTGFTISY